MRSDIIRLSRQHPLVVRQIQKLGGWDNYTPAAVWTGVKRDQGLLNHVGTIRNDHGTGRSLDVYCNGWQPKKDNLRHEVKATDFCLQYPSATFRRGYHVGEFRPDIEMELNGETYLIEIDCGTMTRPQVQRRWQKYRTFNPDHATILIVSVSNPLKGIDSTERIQELLRWSESMYGIALFTRLEDVLGDPLGSVLWDADQQRLCRLKTRSVETV